MGTIAENLTKIKNKLGKDVTLVAVSKTKPKEYILEAYQHGHRHFGENKIQEMNQKQESLPKDIKWHMIGHLQTNKVKYIAKYIHLIHTVDSLKLLKEINKRAIQENRVIQCLLQVKIAQEETKFGLDKQELLDLLQTSESSIYSNVHILGLMGMATYTSNEKQIKDEFSILESYYQSLQEKYNFTILSMGMSSDYLLALEHNSNMVRIGSKVFGTRNYN